MKRREEDITPDGTVGDGYPTKTFVRGLRTHSTDIIKGHRRLCLMMSELPNFVVFKKLEYRDLQSDFGQIDPILVLQSSGHKVNLLRSPLRKKVKKIKGL